MNPYLKLLRRWDRGEINGRELQRLTLELKRILATRQQTLDLKSRQVTGITGKEK